MHFHIVKRDSCPFWKKLCLYLAAVAAALVLGCCCWSWGGIPLLITSGCLLWVW